MERTKFKHHTQVRVRNYEIDWQGIVHNANHLLYFEVGRVVYLGDVGIKVDINTIQHDSKVVVARNEIDYRSPARFGEVLDVYTRISYIRETSFVFEGFIEDSASKRLISENVSVHVWLDHRTDRPLRVPEEFRKWVQRFEGSNVSIP